MARFKVGDKVILTAEIGPSTAGLHIGDEATVSAVDGDLFILQPGGFFAKGDWLKLKERKKPFKFDEGETVVTADYHNSNFKLWTKCKTLVAFEAHGKVGYLLESETGEIWFCWESQLKGCKAKSKRKETKSENEKKKGARKMTFVEYKKAFYDEKITISMNELADAIAEIAVRMDDENAGADLFITIAAMISMELFKSNDRKMTLCLCRNDIAEAGERVIERKRTTLKECVRFAVAMICKQLFDERSEEECEESEAE